MTTFCLPYRRAAVVVAHLAMAAAAYLLAFILRFGLPLPSGYWGIWLETLPLVLLVRGATFAWFHLYEGLWRYVGMRDVLSILKAVTLSPLVSMVAVLGIVGRSFPWGVVVLDWLICLALFGGMRLTLRAFRESRRHSRQVPRKRAVIIGGGDAGEMLVREIERNPGLDYDVVGYVDNDRDKQGKRIHGKGVLGRIDELPDRYKFKYDLTYVPRVMRCAGFSDDVRMFLYDLALILRSVWVTLRGRWEA